MATTKRDMVYSTFITEVVPKLTGMSIQELVDSLSDITKRMDTEIDLAKESEIYRGVSETLTDEEVKLQNDEQDRIQLLKEEMGEEPIEIEEAI